LTPSSGAQTFDQQKLVICSLTVFLYNNNIGGGGGGGAEWRRQKFHYYVIRHRRSKNRQKDQNNFKKREEKKIFLTIEQECKRKPSKRFQKVEKNRVKIIIINKNQFENSTVILSVVTRRLA
jgi:hypothetical protein